MNTKKSKIISKPVTTKRWLVLVGLGIVLISAVYGFCFKKLGISPAASVRVPNTILAQTVSIVSNPIGGEFNLIHVTDTYKRITISSIILNSWNVIDNSNDSIGEIKFSKNDYSIVFDLYRPDLGSCEFPSDKNYGKSTGKMDAYRFQMSKYIEVFNYTGSIIRIDNSDRPLNTPRTRSICESSLSEPRWFTLRPYSIVHPATFDNTTFKEITEILKKTVVL